MQKWLLRITIAAAALTAAARPASADWTITPFVGWNFGGSADVNAGAAGQNTSTKFKHKADFGVSIAGVGSGAVGFELDFGYSPNFFETTTPDTAFQLSSDSNVTTLMGNLLIGAHGGAVRPYVVGGVGLIRTRVQDVGGLFDVSSKNDFGFDVGGGVNGFFTDNIGIRGDIRYFRGVRGSDEDLAGLGVSDFRFWRASAGVSFKF